ncbi:MAG: helix-turn-helix domain-containing protein [Sciscionella sp.]
MTWANGDGNIKVERTGTSMATRRDGLARRRAAMGFTLETLAERLGIERSTVGRWERGTMTPLPWNQPDLAKALELSPKALADLLRNRDSTTSPPATYESPAAMMGQLSLREDRGPGVVARIQATARAFQTADRRVGGGVLYPSVVRYLNFEIGPSLLDPGEGIHSSALFAAAASMTEIAGWMSHDCGQDVLAHQYFDRAFRLASAAHNPALAGNACASMAHLAIEFDQADHALRIATVGLDGTRETAGAQRLITRLYSMRARAFALRGERSSCTQELDAAERTLAGATREAAADWIADFDDASLAGEAALCFLQLSEYREAERQAREVIRLRSGDRVRSRAFGQLTLANVLLEAGHPDETASLGREVCQLTSSLSSARVIQRLNELGQSLTAARNIPEVATFLAALGALRHVCDGQEGRTVTWPV